MSLNVARPVAFEPAEIAPAHAPANAAQSIA
jgi:hypothetical protein